MPQESQPALSKVGPAAEIAKKRALLAKVIERRGAALLNKGAVLKGNKSHHYCWISVHEDQRNYYEGLGYKLVTDPEVETNWKQKDGTHRRGDCILYCIDKEEKELYDYLSETNAIEARESVENQFLEAATRLGVEAFKPEGKNA